MGIRLKLAEESRSPEDEGGKGRTADEFDKGQSQSPDNALEIAKQIGASIAGALDKPSGRVPETKDSQPVHQALGIKDSDAERMKESMGAEAFDNVMGTMHALAQSSRQNDLAIVEQLKTLNDSINTQFASYGKTLEEIRSKPVDTSHLWGAYGLDKVFNEDSKEDLKEYLELVSERSDGFFNAIEQFEKAQEKDDYDYLNRVKSGFSTFLRDKYKSHDSVGGGTGRSSGRANLKQEQELDKQVDELIAKRTELQQNKEFAKAMVVNQEIQKLLAS